MITPTLQDKDQLRDRLQWCAIDLNGTQSGMGAMQSCRNCGSHELYEHLVSVEDMKRVAIFGYPTPWQYNLRVCTTCGLTDWFVPPHGVGWVKRNFKRVTRPRPRRRIPDRAYALELPEWVGRSTGADPAALGDGCETRSIASQPRAAIHTTLECVPTGGGRKPFQKFSTTGALPEKT
jgi:hypothetical protein